MATSVEVDEPIRVLTGGSSHVVRALQFCKDSGRDQHKLGLEENVTVTWVGKGGIQIQRVIDTNIFNDWLERSIAVNAAIGVFLQGGNDLDNDVPGMDDDEHALFIAAGIVTVARAAAPNAKKIFVMSVLPRYKTRNISVDRYLHKMEKCNGHLAFLLNNNVLNLGSEYQHIEYWHLKRILHCTSDLHIDDRVHLNETGNKMLFYEIKKAVSMGLEDPSVWPIPLKK